MIAASAESETVGAPKIFQYEVVITMESAGSSSPPSEICTPLSDANKIFRCDFARVGTIWLTRFKLHATVTLPRSMTSHFRDSSKLT